MISAFESWPFATCQIIELLAERKTSSMDAQEALPCR
jgi:hypothetical protein